MQGALSGKNWRLITASPRKFYMPAYVGPSGWVGLRLDRPTVDWIEVRELVVGSYLVLAPDWQPVVWNEAERGTGNYWGGALPDSFFRYATPDIEGDDPPTETPKLPVFF